MTERDVYLSAGDPLPVGLLMDMPGRWSDVAISVCELVRERYARSGRLERPIEFVVKRVLSAPSAPIKNCIDGYLELADRGALVVMGVNHSDNNIAITPYVEQRKVPLLALGATAQALSEHMFSIAWGSIPDDAYICASWIVQQGCRNVVMTWDRAHHSAEYVQHFRIVARRAGIRILSDERFSQLLGDDVRKQMDETIARFRRLEPDALVHFGTSQVSSIWAGAVTASGWNVPRVMNGAFFGAHDPTYVAGFEGWVGTTLWDDDNPTLKALVAEYAARHPGPQPSPEILAHYHDAITATLEGVTLAGIYTPQGVKQGLESVRMLPAATGGARTCISFGPHDHRGHKGMDLMVLRRVKGGRLVPEGHFEPF
ncbi:MAG: ABC transporter substrate-binding protein [Gammaproteobacteria bacterium]